MKTKKQHALDLAAQGFLVFPLVQNGKTPANEGNWQRTASSDPTRVAEMWTCPVTDADQDHNIGIALDADTLVIDVDTRDGKQGDKSLRLIETIYDELPPTYTVITASGGEHRYYRTANSAGFAKELATHVDLKGEGGYVVAPGSEIDGQRYQTACEGGVRHGKNGTDIANAPDWIKQHAGGGARARARGDMYDAQSVGVDLDTPGAIQRATDYLTNSAPEAIEGAGGDNATIRVANRLGDFGLSATCAAELMAEHWNETKAQPPWDDDELKAKVNNAFKFRQNLVGVASPEAEFDAVDIDAEPAAKRKGIYGVRWEQSVPVLDQPYLIDDVLDLGTMAVTYGDSNAGKTYVVLDQCFHIAAKRDWNGHKVCGGLVVYVAAEGGKGFFKRIEAFKRHYGVKQLPFTLVPCPIDLFSAETDTKQLVKLIKAEEEHFGEKCVLVVIDTLARAMAGGDESTAKDMGAFVTHVDRIRAATGATANVIHHTGKDKAKGARGSSALRAATDTEIEIEPGTVAVTKQRDLAKRDDLHFKLEAVEIGQRSDGKAVTACVVHWVAANEFESELSPLAADMLDVLERLIDAKRDELEDENGGDESDKSDIRIAWQEWQLSCLSCLKGARGKGVSRSALFGPRLELSNSGKVHKDKHNQWFIK